MSSTSASGSDDSEAGSDDESNRVQTSTCTCTTIQGSATESSTQRGKRKQASKFSKDWLSRQELWLKYVQGKGLFCTLCQKYNKSPFTHGTWNTSPCTRLRLQSITTHEHSVTHKDSLKLESANTIIECALNLVIPSKGIEQAFLILYFLAMLRIAHTTKFEPLLDLLGLLGLHVKSKIQIAKEYPVY